MKGTCPRHVSPWCFLSTRRNLEEVLPELKAKREIGAVPARTNAPALSSTCTCGRQRQGTLALVWPALDRSLDIEPNLTSVD